MANSQINSSTREVSIIQIQWNEHNIPLASFCQQMFRNGSMFDVEITCGCHVLGAHKLVLAANSQFFESMLVNSSCKKKEIIICGVQFEDLKAIIDFMYFGEVTVPQIQLKSLFNAAREMKVKILQDLTVVDSQTSEYLSIVEIYNGNGLDPRKSNACYGGSEGTENGSQLDKDSIIKLDESTKLACYDFDDLDSWVVVEKQTINSDSDSSEMLSSSDTSDFSE